MESVLSLDAILSIMVLAETLVNVADVALPRTPGSSEPVFGNMHFCRARNPIQDHTIQFG